MIIRKLECCEWGLNFKSCETHKSKIVSVKKRVNVKEVINLIKYQWNKKNCNIKKLN